MRCLLGLWVFFLICIVSCGHDYKRDAKNKSAEIERLQQQLAAAEHDKNNASTSLEEAKTELAKISAKLAHITAALQPVMGNDFRPGAGFTALDVTRRLTELNRNSTSGRALRKNLATALGVALDASDETITTALTQLKDHEAALTAKIAESQKQLEASLAVQAELADKLKESLADNERLRSIGNVGVLPDILEPFSGIWAAESDQVKTIPAGCRLMVRIDSKPNRVMRAVICDDGRTDYIAMIATFFGTSPSPFPGSILLTIENRVERSSCKDRPSTIAGITSSSFDLRTSTGGMPASYAYAQLGDQRVTLHNGAGIIELNRNNRCDEISAHAARLGGAANAMLKAAKKACDMDSLPAGCFAPGGYIPAAR